MSTDYFVGVLTGIMLGFPLTYLLNLLVPDTIAGVRAWRRGRR